MDGSERSHKIIPSPERQPSPQQSQSPSLSPDEVMGRRDLRESREGLAQRIEEDKQESSSISDTVKEAAQIIGIPVETAATIGGFTVIVEKIMAVWEKVYDKLWDNPTLARILKYFEFKEPDRFLESPIPGEIRFAMETAGLTPVKEDEDDSKSIDQLRTRYEDIPVNERPSSFRAFYRELIDTIKNDINVRSKLTPPYTIAQLVNIEIPTKPKEDPQSPATPTQPPQSS